MSIQDIAIRQRDFTSGEINPDALRRDDVEQLRTGVRHARNLVSTPTGGLKRRPGRRMIFIDTGISFDFRPFDDIAYTVVLIAGGVKIRTDTGTLITRLSAPWLASDLEDLTYEVMDNEVFVAWRQRVQVISAQKGTNSWSIAPFSFATDISGTSRVPFYRFEDTANITMLPSGLTGNITLLFSQPVLTANHAGTIFRYAGRQLQITAVNSSISANAKVLENLPPTYSLTLDDASGFAVGQIVEADTSGAKGEVAAVAGNVVTFVTISRIIKPQVDEKLISPSGKGKISAVAAAAPAAAVQWDEQFMSDARGWPRSVSKDRQRLIFTNFPQKKNAVLWSAISANRDYLIGADPEDAILEWIGEECQVFHVIGGYDEFAVTDKGVFYIPVSVGTPLQPGSIEFRIIFSSELSSIRPIQVTEGLMFVDKARNGVYAISATGQTARPYIANEINRYHRHLFGAIKSIAVTSATPDFPSRQLYVVNDDGTYVTGQFNPDREYVGWLKQDGSGYVRNVAGSYGKVIFMTQYVFNGLVYGVGELLDSSCLADCSQTFSTADTSDSLQLNNGQKLQLSTGKALNISAVVASFYAGKTVSVYAGGFWFGKVAVPSNGVVAGYSQYDEITLGVDFDWTLTPLFINVEGGDAMGQGEQKRKIKNMKITVRETQEFKVGNRKFGSHRGGEDTAQPIPERDETYGYREFGRSYDPAPVFSSTFPCKFKLIELNTRITV
ncbi:hypothetical protein [Gellertiella hungarica]|uniref:Uncharacterized protein n=1 Tax=Gellertiella hungarica TaxID=1572859 RepID=A0A7W6JAA9_9HYPH|nr:hypothetical protein [Gellertiella hungarica]MBB4066753.1 hypothetical protein [Gellertiella hungarica]